METKPFFPTEKTHDLDEGTRRAARKTVLIVDDEPNFIKSVGAYLESFGFQVDSATDGTQGIKKILLSDYAVILCDMVMPNLAGDMFYRAVERVKPHLCRRFIFVTGHHHDPSIDAFIRKVRGLVLWKPFQFHVLMEAVQAVDKRGAEGASGSTEMLFRSGLEEKHS